MMNLNNKDYLLKSFTILEAIITMIITSVVITIGITLYVDNQKQFFDYLRVSNTFQDGIQTIAILKTDIEQAECIYADKELLEIENRQGLITYSLEEAYIVRKNEREKRDTFNVGVLDYEYTYLNQSHKLITNIYLNIEIDVFHQELNFFKRYSNSILFNLSNER